MHELDFRVVIFPFASRGIDLPTALDLPSLDRDRGLILTAIGLLPLAVSFSVGEFDLVC
jgi:hypothetical protein